MLTIQDKTLKIKIPKSYICGISSQIKIDPVIAADGCTYEREAIEQWFQNHDTSPRNHKKLEDKKLHANHEQRNAISYFLMSHPELYDEKNIYPIPKSWLSQCVLAIKENQIQEAKYWLDKDRRLLTFKLEGDFTALHLACEFGSLDLVDTLLKTLIQKNQAIMPGVSFKLTHLTVLLQNALHEKDNVKISLLLKLGATANRAENPAQLKERDKFNKVVDEQTSKTVGLETAFHHSSIQTIKIKGTPVHQKQSQEQIFKIQLSDIENENKKRIFEIHRMEAQIQKPLTQRSTPSKALEQKSSPHLNLFLQPAESPIKFNECNLKITSFIEAIKKKVLGF